MNLCFFYNQPGKLIDDIFMYNFSHFRDARGMTPFMSAVSGRAYPAAITILETAQKIAKGNLFQVLNELLIFNLNRFSSIHVIS